MHNEGPVSNLEMEQAEWASDNIKTKKSEDGHVAMHVIETY
jgi:hypothetical protein